MHSMNLWFKVDMQPHCKKKVHIHVLSLAVRKVSRLWVHADTSSFWTLHQIPLTLSLSLCSVLVTSQRSAAWPFSLINPAYTHSLIHTCTAGSSKVLGCWVSWKSTEHLIKTFWAFCLMAAAAQSPEAASFGCLSPGQWFMLCHYFNPLDLQSSQWAWHPSPAACPWKV